MALPISLSKTSQPTARSLDFAIKASIPVQSYLLHLPLEHPAARLCECCRDRIPRTYVTSRLWKRFRLESAGTSHHEAMQMLSWDVPSQTLQFRNHARLLGYICASALIFSDKPSICESFDLGDLKSRIRSTAIMTTDCIVPEF